MRLTLFAPLLFAVHLLAAAAGDAPQNVGVLVEWIELPEREAAKLIREHIGKGHQTDLREVLEAKIDAGEAEMVATSYVRTKSRQRAKVESILEFIYPTEYDPPEIPQEIHGPIGEGVEIPITHANPTAFEMRPLGTTMEVDPSIAPGGAIIDLNIAPESVEFVRLEAYSKEEGETVMPLFYTMKETTAVTVASGAYTLISVQTPRAKVEGAMHGDPARRVLVFVRADVSEVEVHAGAARDDGAADDPFSAE